MDDKLAAKLIKALQDNTKSNDKLAQELRGLSKEEQRKRRKQPKDTEQFRG